MASSLNIGNGTDNLTAFVLDFYNSSSGQYFRDKYAHTGDGISSPLFTYVGGNSDFFSHPDTTALNAFNSMLSGILESLSKIAPKCNLRITYSHSSIYYKEHDNIIRITINFLRDDSIERSIAYKIFEDGSYTNYFFIMYEEINAFLNDNPDCRKQTNNCFLLGCFPDKYTKKVS